MRLGRPVVPIVLTIETTGQTTVPTDGSYIDNFPSWSPDGSTIAFTRNMQGNYDIFTIRPDGSGLQRLTTDPGNDAHSTWSPDGQWIAFVSGQGVQGRDAAASRESSVLRRDLCDASRRFRRALPH